MDLEIPSSKLIPGSSVNVKWNGVWYGGTIIKLGPKAHLFKVLESDGQHQFLVERSELKKVGTGSDSPRFLYNNGDLWTEVTVLDTSATGTAKVSWRKHVYDDEVETWFELEDIAPLIRNEAYDTHDLRSRSNMLVARMLDERPRTVENVLYESDNESDNHILENGSNFSESEDEYIESYPPSQTQSPWNQNQYKRTQANMAMVPPPIGGMNKTKINISQTSVPCLWTYNNYIPKQLQSTGIAPHYASTFFVDLRTRPGTKRNHSLQSSSTTQKRTKPSPAKSAYSEEIATSDKTKRDQRERRHSKFNQFSLRRDSRMENWTKTSKTSKSEQKYSKVKKVCPPEIVSASPGIVKVKPSKNVLLTCTAISSLPVTYKWLKNRKVVPQAPNISLPGPGILQILKVTDANAGDYSCTASNEHGSTSKSFKLIVQSDSERMERQRDQINQLPDTMPESEVQNFLDTILIDVQEFHDSLEDISPNSKAAATIPKIALTAAKYASVDTFDEMDQYLVGYGDDYGATSSTKVDDRNHQMSPLAQTHHKTGAIENTYDGGNSIDVHTSLGSTSAETEQSSEYDRPKLELPVEKDTVMNLVQRFQMSMPSSEDSHLLKTKRDQSTPKRIFGGIFKKRTK